MSFVLKKSDSYLWPVTVELPKNGGGFNKQTFQAEFKRVPQSELKKLIDGEGEKAPTDVDFCKAVIVGWKDINDEKGESISFSDDSLNELLEIPVLAKTLVTTYLESLAGSKIKN